MQIVLCDGDSFLREVIETVVTRTGHEVVGTAESAAGAVALIESVRPDAVIADLSPGYTSDFDVIDAAIRVRARPIVFSHHAFARLKSDGDAQELTRRS